MVVRSKNVIRNAARALVFYEDKLLTIKLKEKYGTYYLLPGGGQEVEENISEALQRECLEEIGLELTIGDLIFVREYIGKNHELASIHSGYHQIEYIFECHLKEAPSWNEISGSTPDQEQVGVEWIAVDKLLQFNLLPKDLRNSIVEFYHGMKTPVYVGDIN